MKHLGLKAVCLFASAFGVLSTPSEHAARAQQEPCAIVRDAQVGGSLSVPAKTAYECLKSVPFDKEGNIQVVKEVKSYFGFQSNLAWLKDPPPNYDNPKVDILGSLDDLLTRVEKGSYASEYDFALDLWNLTLQARDGHFSYFPDILSVFQFKRQTELVSLSSDGQALPQIYVLCKFASGYDCRTADIN